MSTIVIIIVVVVLITIMILVSTTTLLKVVNICWFMELIKKGEKMPSIDVYQPDLVSSCIMLDFGLKF